MTTINASSGTKQRIAGWGPNKLFGNPDERERMTSKELEKLFDHVWRERLRPAVERSKVWSAEQVRERLTQAERKYLDMNQEHRQFRLNDLNLEFIAQLEPNGSGAYSLTQLWTVWSTDTDPKGSPQNNVYFSLGIASRADGVIPDRMGLV